MSTFLESPNSQYSSILITMEVRGKKISFLDLNISIINGSHEFSIFRKFAATDTLIHRSYFCPNSHKLAAFNAMTHRLVIVPMNSQDFRNEVNAMKQLTRCNDINVGIDRPIKRKLTRHTSDLTTYLPREYYSFKRLKWINPQPPAPVSRSNL